MSTYSPAKRGITNDHREEQHPRGNTPACAGKASLKVILRAVYRGNTPAYAGKTQFEPLFHLLPKEHPRPYGENHIDKLGDAVKEGTSLLVRGIHLFILVTSYTPESPLLIPGIHFESAIITPAPSLRLATYGFSRFLDRMPYHGFQFTRVASSWIA